MYSRQAVVCLLQDNNTLSAEIELAAAATIVRKIGNSILTSEQVEIPSEVVQMSCQSLVCCRCTVAYETAYVAMHGFA